jgi:hypothetical protein
MDDRRRAGHRPDTDVAPNRLDVAQICLSVFSAPFRYTLYMVRCDLLDFSLAVFIFLVCDFADLEYGAYCVL